MVQRLEFSHMGLLQQPVQAKLSKLIGAEVRFDNLSVSLLGGSIEARGVTVAGDDPAQPVLTVRRLRAEISVPRALKREIVIKSLTIEAPVVSIVRRADGRTNLPKPVRAEDEEGEAESPARAKTVDETASGDDAPVGAWKLEAQRVLVVDGAVSYHADATPGGGEALDLSAQSVLAEVKSSGGGLDFTCIAESLGSRGAIPAALGQLKFAGRAEGVADLSQLLNARITATAEADGLLRAEIEIPSLRPLRAAVKATAAADVAKLVPLMPKALCDRLPPTPPGRVELRLAADYTPAELNVTELSIRAESLRLKP
jgi:hypothetical protein